MAESKTEEKKATAKKPAVKKTVEKKVAVEEPNLVSGDVEFGIEIAENEKPIVIDEVTPELKENIENVSVEIPRNNESDIIETMTADIEPVQEAKAEVEEAIARQDKVADALEGDKEVAKKVIEEELASARKIAEKIDKLITEAPNKVKPKNITNWWNVMGYDF